MMETPWGKIDDSSIATIGQDDTDRFSDVVIDPARVARVIGDLLAGIERDDTEPLAAWDPGQPRDKTGKWTSGPGGGAGRAGGASRAGGARSGDDAFMDAASSGRVSTSGELGGGVCNAKIVNYEGDGSGVWKATSEPKADQHDGNSEVAAYELSKLLGFDDLVPPTTFSKLDGIDGTSQKFIDGFSAAIEFGEDYITDYVRKNAKNASDILKMATLDAIMVNFDRHTGNFGFDASGKLWAIDHGHASWMDNTTGYRGGTVDNYVFSDTLGRMSSLRGSVKLPKAWTDKWRKITRKNWDSRFKRAGVSTSRRVKLDAAWNNLQSLIEKGEIVWRP